MALAALVAVLVIVVLALGADGRDGDGRKGGGEVRQGGDPRKATWTCDRTATTRATLSTEFEASSPGQTLCLASGRYGVFRGGVKRGPVTVRARPGASPRLSLEFSGAENIRVEGVTITGGVLSGGTRNVTIANSRFTGILLVEQETPDPNIVLDGNSHNNIPGAVDDYTSRVQLDAPGVVVKNSLFSGGTSDGIRVGNAPDMQHPPQRVHRVRGQGTAPHGPDPVLRQRAPGRQFAGTGSTTWNQSAP